MGRLIALLANIRLGLKWLAVKKTLAYGSAIFIAAVK
jgi:hypothetical protein